MRWRDPRVLTSTLLCSYLPLIEVMIPVVRTIPDIRKEAGQLNLRYERQEPGAIKIFRKVWCTASSNGLHSSLTIRARLQMVTDCLSGVQETLNTCVIMFRKLTMYELCLSCCASLSSYNVRHDVFDFESELGWEGSNDKVRALPASSGIGSGSLFLSDWAFAQVMAIMKNSDYFVPPTQCNSAGVPQVGTGECVCALGGVFS